MGGASRALGNVTPAAEFNIHADPHAAEIVFASGMPITMILLDATHQVRSTQGADRAYRRDRHAGRRGGRRAAAADPAIAADALHDPCVIAYLLAPELFKGSRVNVAVEMRKPA